MDVDPYDEFIIKYCEKIKIRRMISYINTMKNLQHKFLDVVDKKQ